MRHTHMGEQAVCVLPKGEQRVWASESRVRHTQVCVGQASPGESEYSLVLASAIYTIWCLLDDILKGC